MMWVLFFPPSQMRTLRHGGGWILPRPSGDTWVTVWLQEGHPEAHLHFCTALAKPLLRPSTSLLSSSHVHDTWQIPAIWQVKRPFIVREMQCTGEMARRQASCLPVTFHQNRPAQTHRGYFWLAWTSMRTKWNNVGNAELQSEVPTEVLHSPFYIKVRGQRSPSYRQQGESCRVLEALFKDFVYIHSVIRNHWSI